MQNWAAHPQALQTEREKLELWIGRGLCSVAIDDHIQQAGDLVEGQLSWLGFRRAHAACPLSRCNSWLKAPSGLAANAAGGPCSRIRPASITTT